MSRNGSGIYSLATGNPVITGTTISSTWANVSLSDIATAITQSIAADGQTTISSNLPMSNYAHTGVADATVRTMYASAGQVQDSASTYLTSTAGTNTITATAILGMAAYATGQIFRFIAAGANTGACTLNINSVGAKSLFKTDGSALVSGDIVLGAAVQVMYDGTNFQLLSDANNATKTVTTLTATTKVVTPQIGSSSGAFTIQSANTTAISINASQVVGIGTTGATAKVVINGYVLNGGQNYSFQTSDAINSTFSVGHQSGVTNLITDAALSLYAGSAKAITIDTSGNVFVGGTTSTTSTVPVYAKTTAKAWVRFVGSAATIASSFNVSSITRTAAGQYTCNFTTALADANYSVTGSSSYSPGLLSVVFVSAFCTGNTVVTPTTSAFVFSNCAYNNTYGDSAYTSITVFGN